MTRHADWEARLNAALEKHRDLAGAWGFSDCWVMEQDAYFAVTGEKLLPHLSGYKTERGGYKLFAKSGFVTVEQALESVLPSVPPLMAQRGDLAVIEREGVLSCGVVTAIGVAVKTIYGDAETQIISHAALEYHPITKIKSAFRVN